MQTIKVVLFDLGHVLVDLGPKERFTRIFPLQGVSEAELWEHWLASPSVKAFDAGQISLDSFIDRLLAELSLEADREALKQAFIAWPQGLYDGAIELVQRIPAHYHRAVLSNTNDAHWARILDDMGLAGLFHQYFASHQVGLVKPELSLFEHVIAKLGVAPNEILFIDDNQINVEAARQAGMQAEWGKGIQCAQEILLTYGVIR
ncbi:HAD family hydrolase [Marinomonas ostreistagni]|uniref:HAD family hydrolase n=1 Tax=Marinomonas ostreistagni TaxID=359209 RepID=UPI001951C479|nr:HAD family phosphatase [Marinomonas ostreistagni]MBM6549638.1 HAD family phosphatase [Marinomonas ostreistagni]